MGFWEDGTGKLRFTDFNIFSFSERFRVFHYLVLLKRAPCVKIEVRFCTSQKSSESYRSYLMLSNRQRFFNYLYVVVQFYLWFSFYCSLFLCMVMCDNEYKSRKIKLGPWIKLNHSKYTNMAAMVFVFSHRTKLVCSLVCFRVLCH